MAVDTDMGQFDRFDGLPPLKREGNIIYFPGAWREEPSPRHEPDGKTDWKLCREIAGELGLRDIKYYSWRIIVAIREANVKSTEELARVPLEDLALGRGVGARSVATIREALRNKGYEIPDGTTGNAP